MRISGSIRVTVAVAAAVVALGLAGFYLLRSRERRADHKPMNNNTLREGRRPLKLPMDAPSVVIEKQSRRLLLYDGPRQVRSYRIALGTNPVGDKQREGDGRTPEGAFYVTHKNPHSKYTLSLGLSYPNKKHAARGLQGGLITKEQHDAIVGAIDEKQIPPWKTPLGGEIFIHGAGSARDWTLGCIALDDDDVRELFEAVPPGTSVIIEP